MARGLATLCLLASPWGAAASPAVEDETTAVKANEFLNSIGVCTHISQGKDNPTKVAECLTYAGIRGIRDDGSRNPGTLQSFIDVYKNSGAKVVLLPINGNVEASLNEYETLAAAGALLAAEGPNEPNNWRVTYNGATSSNQTSMPIAQFQKDLYAAVKADPKLAGIPVFHSSEAGGSQPDNCGLQFLAIPAGAGTKMPDGTVFADYANTHNYVCARDLKGITEDNIAWNAEDPVLNGKWDGLYVEYGHTWWGKGFDGYTRAQLETLPRVTTETGWSTRAGGGGHHSAITEEEQGRLFLNLYLAAFKRGWSYTFIYMLHDHPGDGYWGLVHTDYTPKLSATYLHNMTTILVDKSSSFTPGKLRYAIAGKPVTVHDLLMQKSDGTFELAVWGEQVKGSNDITVSLGAACASVKVYDPTVGTAPVQTLANVNSVPLTVGDHALIIEIPSAGRKPIASAGVPAEKRAPVRPETLAAWDAKLLARIREEVQAGRKPRFRWTAVGDWADITEVNPKEDLRIQGRDGGALLAWSSISLADRRSIAVALVRQGRGSDHALAAFYLLALGEKESAQPHLDKAGSAADEVTAAFR
jgi:hypothetical protein